MTAAIEATNLGKRYGGRWAQPLPANLYPSPAGERIRSAR